MKNNVVDIAEVTFFLSDIFFSLTRKINPYLRFEISLLDISENKSNF